MICTKKRKGREIFVHLYVNDNRHLLIHTNTKKRNVVALLLFFYFNFLKLFFQEAT